MANKKEREKQLQDKIQIILSDLLKDDDNKYCVDCDGKGPRWASWSLGIFLCIRCAGIHRNLGVHISRVKSVNLDSWTPQQVAMMKEIGNSRGRAIYEANLDDNFRRPQTDTTLEQFIRAKYEHKRYIAKEWIPPNPSADVIADDIRKLEHNLHKKRTNHGVNNNTNIGVIRRNVEPQVLKTETPVSKPEESNHKVDLLGLDTVATDDTFGDFVFASQAPVVPSVGAAVQSSGTVSSAVDDLMGLHIGGTMLASNGLCDISMGTAPSVNATLATGLPLDKNSILALYNNVGGGGGAANTGSVAMGQGMAAGWPGIGVPHYQQTGLATVADPQLFYGGAQQGGSFGTQHNPFFNNISFPAQATFPATVAGQTQQHPNSILW